MTTPLRTLPLARQLHSKGAHHEFCHRLWPSHGTDGSHQSHQHTWTHGHAHQLVQCVCLSPKKTHYVDSQHE